MKNFSFLKFTIGSFLGLTLAALVAFNVLLIWVASGPRSLDKFAPYIEMALTGESGVKVKIGKTFLLWDGWRNPLDLHLRDVELINENGEVFSRFPELSLGVDVIALPFGEILPTSLSVTNPQINIRQNEDLSFRVNGSVKTAEQGDNNKGDNNIASAADALAALVESLINPRSKSSLRKLRFIECVDADFTISDFNNNIIISAPRSSLIISKESSSDIRASLRGAVNYEGRTSPVEGKFSYNKRKKRFEGVVETSKINPAELSRLLFGKHWLSGFDIPISGKIGFAFAKDGTLDTLQFALNGNAGKIIHQDIAAPLEIKNLRLNGSLTDGLNTLSIDNFQANVAGSNLRADGRVSFPKAATEDNAADKTSAVIDSAAISRAEIKGKISINDVPTDKAAIFWPPSLAPISRDWIVDNIKGGKIEKASAIINIKSGDLALAALPREAVDATISLKGAQIRYLPSHPEIRSVDAEIKIDGVALKAQIAKAEAFADSLLSKGEVVIADLNQNNPFIEIALHADAAASDIAKLLALPMLEHAGRLNIAAAKTTGRATGSAKIGLYFFAKDESGAETPIAYDIKSSLHDVSLPEFLKRFDIKNATGELTVNEQEIAYKGTASVNNSIITNGDISYRMLPQDDVDTIIKANTTIDNEALERFGLSLPVEIGKYRNSDIDLAISTQRDAVLIKQFKISGNDVVAKENQQLSEKNAVSENSNGNNVQVANDISAKTISTKTINLNGNAEFTKDGNDIAYLTMNRIEYGKSKLSNLEYKKHSDNSYSLRIAGHSLDLSETLGAPANNINNIAENNIVKNSSIGKTTNDKTTNEKNAIAKNITENSTTSEKSTPENQRRKNKFSFADFPPLTIELDIAKVFAAYGQELSNVKGSLQCRKYCEKADLQAAIGDKKITFSIKPEGKNRKVTIVSDDAGKLLRAIGITDSMEGGNLSISGQFTNNDANSSLLRGELLIRDYTLKNTPLLAKILSLASLTGFFDTLSGNGISFKKLSAPFTIQRDIITTKEARTYGSAIGITADGTIVFPARTLNIEGTIVPSYTLNNVVGKVPVLGDILTGGEGQGVFAARYTVKGDSEEPEVMVNPLSFLTPGFLRHLFDAF